MQVEVRVRAHTDHMHYEKFIIIKWVSLSERELVPSKTFYIYIKFL